MAGACSVGVGAICDAVKSLAGQAGVAVSDIDHFVFHQANERILSAAVKLLGVDDARVVRTLRSTGNISSACIPLALDSLATVEVVVAIEGDLDIELDQSVNPETVGEFVDLVEAQLEK